jgi:hypothetical protein
MAKNFRAGNASSIVNGGTAVAAIIGPCNGGYIANPANAAAQGIGAAEALYVDPTTPPGHADANANGTCSAIQPGGVWTLAQPIGTGQTIWANATTTNHAFTVVIN